MIANIFSMPAGLLFVRMDGSKVEQLQRRLLELNAKAVEIQERADAEGRELTAEEIEQTDMIRAEFDSTEADIERRLAIEAQQTRLAQPGQRQVPAGEPALESDPQASAAQAAAAAAQAAGTPASSQRRGRVQVIDNHPGRWGFSGIGEFSLAVARATQRNGYVDNRLVIHNAPTTASQEGVGSDGGYAVPPDFRTEIAEKVMGDEFSLFGRTDMIPTSKNTLVLPKDESSPWDTTGIQAKWGDELSQLDQSKIAISNNQVPLHKLYVLTPVSEELLEDAPAMDAFLRRKAPERMNWKIEEAIVRGPGVGRPLGLMNAPAKVVVAAEAGPQAADSLVVENIVNMWSRMPARNRRNAVWLMNQDLEPQLLPLKIEGSNSGVFPVYMPPGNLSAAPFGTILGRPIIPTEACSTRGDEGDLIFADLSQYLTSVKQGGVRFDISMHLWFDWDALAYRFIIRIAGQPWWSQPWTRRDANSPDLSAYVILGARTGS